ncbi:MAG: NADP-dependent oxidoreductase, partial [Spirochaetales bacterium]|nr:NADP-dependent oxidoreductase [Spirochaetales bacterium]
MKNMNAVVIERFGDESELTVRSVPVPEIGRNEVLIRVEYAGVGSWDVFERTGGYAGMFGASPGFPYILGSEGAGTVVAVGGDVTRFRTGDSAMASGFLNPRGGFYAEYVAVAEETVAAVPADYSTVEAAVVLGVGITALRGVVDVLKLRLEESLCVFGASGGIGHVAVQIARALSARVAAVASGVDGVELVRRLGVDSAFDGRDDTMLRSVRAAAGDGFDKVLLTAGGAQAD